MRHTRLMVKKSHKFLPSQYAHSFLLLNVYVCICVCVCMYFLLQLPFKHSCCTFIQLTKWPPQYDCSPHQEWTLFPYSLNLRWPADLLWPKKVTELPPCDLWASVSALTFLQPWDGHGKKSEPVPWRKRERDRDNSQQQTAKHVSWDTLDHPAPYMRAPHKTTKKYPVEFSPIMSPWLSNNKKIVLSIKISLTNGQLICPVCIRIRKSEFSRKRIKLEAYN